MKYQKYFRKTSLKQKGVGDFFLNEIAQKKPKTFLEVGVFHGVTARNVCELLYSFHGTNFNYIGLDLFEESDETKDQNIPSTKFKNPFTIGDLGKLKTYFKNTQLPIFLLKQPHNIFESRIWVICFISKKFVLSFLCKFSRHSIINPEHFLDSPTRN